MSSTESNNNMYGFIGCQRNVPKSPSYAYTLKDNSDFYGYTNHPFICNPETRYPIVWKLGEDKLFGCMNPTMNNLVTFNNIDMFGGCVKTCIYTGDRDYDNHNAFVYLYNSVTKDLYCVALSARDGRFGGIVLEPMSDINLHHYRVKYLMNKWRRLTPIIGKVAIILKQFYVEVSFRPDNSGAKATRTHFEECQIMSK